MAGRISIIIPRKENTMKDTTFSARSKKRELIILLLSFIAANILNLAGILKFNTPASELLSQLHVVVIVTIFLYLAVLVLRILWLLLKLIYYKINSSK